MAEVVSTGKDLKSGVVQDKRNIILSKSLSWILRHGALKEGLSFDDGGYIDVCKILGLKHFQNYSEKDIILIVEQNDKQRFSLRSNPYTKHLQIRANQGHSLPVKEEKLLTALTVASVPEVLIHGTFFSKLDKIMKYGLHRMRRNHIHFAPGLSVNAEVVAGIRKYSEICIVVDSKKAANSGLKFYRSDNNVFLCPGDDNGYISPSYFKEVWQMSPRKKMLNLPIVSSENL